VADDEVKLSAPQARNLGIRVTHPVSSRTDQTLPYPAQIVIPTPQLWVVSALVAGMVANLAIARGDRVNVGQPLVTLESPMHRQPQNSATQPNDALGRAKRSHEIGRIYAPD
jgi:membrane fusion protein, heavy metal efflux system